MSASPVQRWRRWFRHRPGELPLDGWSLIHLGSGVLLGAIFRGSWGWLVLGLLVVYEAFEAALRRGKSGKGVFEHESWANIVYDVLFGMIGWLFAQGLPAFFAWP